MATMNSFGLLGDADIEDPSLFIAAQEQKVAAAAAATGGAQKAPAVGAGTKKGPAAEAAKEGAKFPSKPQPPSQAVREARNETGRARAGRGYGRGRGPAGFNREFANGENTPANENGIATVYKEDRDRPYERRGGYGGPRGGFHGGRRGGYGNGEVADGERPRRTYDRRSGTGRGSDFKRDGAGRGNWGTPADEITLETEQEPVAENEANVATDKQPEGEENGDAEKDNAVNESEEKEPEEKQMTLEEYEKVLEEKRKALESLKVQERKVAVDKELQSMQVVSKKKNEEEVFIKLGSDKDKRKEAAEKEERAKKSMSINEFLKPSEGESYYRPGGRGRGRGSRGRSGGYTGGYSNVRAPSIEDPSQFPSLVAN